MRGWMGAEGPALEEVFAEARKAFATLGKQVQEALEKFQEDAQYRFDKELGKQLAKHPELYAELKRGYRQFRKGLDKTARDLGLK